MTSVEIYLLFPTAKFHYFLQFTVKKYLDLSLPTAQVQPTTISKINTVMQFILVGTALGLPIVGMQDHPAFLGLWYDI